MCRCCETIEFWKESEKDKNSKLFAKIAVYCWKKGERRIKGEEYFNYTTRAYDLKYCPSCRKEAWRVKFETKKKLRDNIGKLEKEKKQLIEERETNYNLYKAIIAIMLRENRKCIEIDFRDVLAADDYELAFYNNPFKTTKEIKLVRRTNNDNY